MSKKFYKNDMLFVEISDSKHQEILSMFDFKQTYFEHGMIFERMSYHGDATYRIVNKQQFALFCIKYGV